MTDVKREALIQSNGTKESPFFDQNFEDKDILTNIVIPVVFVVIGKFQMNRYQPVTFRDGTILFSAILGTLGNSATVLLLSIKGLKKTTDILVYNLGKESEF